MTERSHFRLVSQRPALRLEIRISARDRFRPHSQSRPFRLTERGLAELLACAQRIEARQ